MRDTELHRAVLQEIDLGCADTVTRWCRELRVSEALLQEAVRAVGKNVVNVRRFFKQARHLRAK